MPSASLPNLGHDVFWYHNLWVLFTLWDLSHFFLLSGFWGLISHPSFLLHSCKLSYFFMKGLFKVFSQEGANARRPQRSLWVIPRPLQSLQWVFLALP